MIFMYTDGLTEIMDPENAVYTEAMLCESLGRRLGRSPGEISGGVLDDVQRFARGVEYPDDICMLIARYAP
jgi:serine phosphatase RsbU (regulator of sigma subunit)